MEPFRLSQSKLSSWDDMCPIEFKARHINKTIVFSPSMEMELGNWFETLVIGGGISGAFDFEVSEHGPAILRSVYYKEERVQNQAKACKEYLKMFGGKIVTRQEYISVEVVDSQGTIIQIEGTLDIVYQLSNGRMALIDLKFTGDTENDFGKFAWGTPEKMDMTQVVHYALLMIIKYNLDYIPETYYWVFDKEKDLKKKLIKVEVSQGAIDAHIERLSEAYQEITLAIAMDDFAPKNTWENCSKCKSPCRYQRFMPEFVTVSL